MTGSETTGARPRVGVYNLYWSTYGGGEQVAGAIALALVADHDVVLLGPEPIDLQAMRDRLSLDLSPCGYERVVDDETASAASASYDLFVNATYLSTATNLARSGLYYVYFPGTPSTRRQRVRQVIARGLATCLRPVVGIPRLRRVHDGLERRAAHTDWTRGYATFVCTSSFTVKWIERLWRVPAQALYPPVRPDVLPGTKGNTITSVGRFFDPKFGHCKKQLDLLRAFIELERVGADGWRLELIGGADAPSRDYALAVRREAQGHAVGVHFNAPRSLVRDTLAAASIYWHGTGYGEDANKHPDRFEHFGIAVVEAMAAGAVPIVFGAAGPAEIVRHGVDGFHWHTTAELVQFTRQLIADRDLRETMAENAQQRAHHFSDEVFAAALRSAVGCSTTL